MLRDLVLMAAAPDRLELTSVSPQFREQLPALAKAIGRARLLQWQAQLRGTEQQLRQSVQPRLWLEVLLLGITGGNRWRLNPQPQPQSQHNQQTTQPTAAVAPPAPAPDRCSSCCSSTHHPRHPPPVTNACCLPHHRNCRRSPALAPAPSTNLPELWQQILGSLELPSTRMLLSQQAQLVRLDANRAVVQVAGNLDGHGAKPGSLAGTGGRQSSGRFAAAGAGSQHQRHATTNFNSADRNTAHRKNTGHHNSHRQRLSPQHQHNRLTAPTPTPAPTSAPIPAPQRQHPQTAPAAAPELPRTQPQAGGPETSTCHRRNPTLATQSASSGLDRQARNLADFFNGQVLDVDEIS